MPSRLRNCTSPFLASRRNSASVNEQYGMARAQDSGSEGRLAAESALSRSLLVKKKTTSEKNRVESIGHRTQLQIASLFESLLFSNQSNALANTSFSESTCSLSLKQN